MFAAGFPGVGHRQKPAQQAKVVKAAAGVRSVFDRAVLPRRGIVGCEGERLTQG